VAETGNTTDMAAPTALAGTWRAPEIPSKFDIIPIHNSDRGTFKDCRRRWDWSSPARHNLTVRADVAGIYQPFFFGSGIHYALESFYTPNLRRDPVEAFKTWHHIQLYGGIVTQDWLARVYDLAPRQAPEAGMALPGGPNEPCGPIWEVRGLKEILPDTDADELDELLELGINMLQAYKEYAARVDDFEVVVTEHDFSVPIWDYENDCILTAIDTREQSPNYGKRLEVHARGRMDALYRKPNGKIGVIDHKTADSMEESETLNLKLEADEQITTYLWAAEVEAQYYDLPHKGQPMEELVYNVLRKAYPKPPTIVRGGLFSIDRKNESTTYELVKEFMDASGIAYMDLSEKHQNYVDWLREIGDEQFFVRKLVRRNRHQLRNAGYRIYLEALDMLNPDLLIYPNLRKSWECIKCQFRPPCMAIETGEDADYLIRENYSHTKDR
jgi:PD-(D/E)XK nuclease superfamily